MTEVHIVIAIYAVVWFAFAYVLRMHVQPYQIGPAHRVLLFLLLMTLVTLLCVIGGIKSIANIRDMMEMIS